VRALARFLARSAGFSPLPLKDINDGNGLKPALQTCELANWRTVMGQSPHYAPANRDGPRPILRVNGQTNEKRKQAEACTTNWETGRLADWETGRLGDWETGRLGDWETGRLLSYLADFSLRTSAGNLFPGVAGTRGARGPSARRLSGYPRARRSGVPGARTRVRSGALPLPGPPPVQCRW